MSSYGVGSALTMTIARPGRCASGHEAGGGVDGEGRARRRAAGRTGGRPLGALEVVGHEVLAEADRRRLEDAAAGAARRVVLAGPHPVERPLHGRPLAARHAHDLAHGAVDLDDLGRVGARLLVQPVDVLGDERVQLARAARGRRWPGGRRWAAPTRRASRCGCATPASAPRGRPCSAAAWPCFSAPGFLVHTPCGPRKSGMPESVEMPAPVSTTTRSRLVDPAPHVAQVVHGPVRASPRLTA